MHTEFLQVFRISDQKYLMTGFVFEHRQVRTRTESNQYKFGCDYIEQPEISEFR